MLKQWLKSFTYFQYFSNNKVPLVSEIEFPHRSGVDPLNSSYNRECTNDRQKQIVYLPLTVTVTSETVCKQNVGIKIIHKLPVGVSVNSLLSGIWSSQQAKLGPCFYFVIKARTRSKQPSIQVSRCAIEHNRSLILIGCWKCSISHGNYLLMVNIQTNWTRR